MTTEYTEAELEGDLEPTILIIIDNPHLFVPDMMVANSHF